MLKGVFCSPVDKFKGNIDEFLRAILQLTAVSFRLQDYFWLILFSIFKS